MEGAVAILLVILAVMFCIGVLGGILSVVFTIKKIHPVASIILSVICWFGVTVAVKFTIGIMVSIQLSVLLGLFNGVIIIMSVKNTKQNKK